MNYLNVPEYKIGDSVIINKDKTHHCFLCYKELFDIYGIPSTDPVSDKFAPLDYYIISLTNYLQ